MLHPWPGEIRVRCQDGGDKSVARSFREFCRRAFRPTDATENRYSLFSRHGHIASGQIVGSTKHGLLNEPWRAAKFFGHVDGAGHLGVDRGCSMSKGHLRIPKRCDLCIGILGGRLFTVASFLRARASAILSPFFGVQTPDMLDARTSPFFGAGDGADHRSMCAFSQSVGGSSGRDDFAPAGTVKFDSGSFAQALVVACIAKEHRTVDHLKSVRSAAMIGRIEYKRFGRPSAGDDA